MSDTPSTKLAESGRDVTGKFTVGHVGMGGRPVGPVKRMQELARQYGDACIAELARQAFDPKVKDADRRAAVNDLLDRGFGKPVQPEEKDEAGNRLPKEIVIKVVRPE